MYEEARLEEIRELEQKKEELMKEVRKINIQIQSANRCIRKPYTGNKFHNQLDKQ